MIEPIAMLFVGAFIALYFSHKPFRTGLHDLFGHVKDAFKEVPEVPPAATPVPPAPTTATIQVGAPAAVPPNVISQ